MSPSGLFIVIPLLVVLAQCAAGQSQPTATSDAGQMVRLHIDLQEGFANDTVVVSVNQDEVFNQPAVQTKLLLGYAETFVVEVPAGLTSVEVALVERQIAEVFELTLTTDTYVGVSVQGDRIDVTTSETPFTYG